MSQRLGLLTLVILALATPVQASVIAGHDYLVLSTPQRQESKGKVEVIEFFSWGCPHCYKLYPLLARLMANTRTGQSEDAAVNYRIGGVPTLAVGGRYTVTGEDAHVLAMSAELIVMARTQDKVSQK